MLINKLINKIKDYNKLTCYVPYSMLIIKKHDGVGICCYHLNKDGFDLHGSVSIEQFDTVWNSEGMNKFRERIKNYDFKYCKDCSIFLNRQERFGNYKRFITLFGKDYATKINNYLYNDVPFNSEYPHTVELAFDMSCNLKCVTCRDEVIHEKDIISDELLNKLINYVKHCTRLIIAGDGEIFISKYYKKILSTDLTDGESNLKAINLMTNGTLFNKNNWNLIHPNNKKLIKEIKISIDAATELTYNNIRLNGDFKTLINNIHFINELKNDYDFKLASTYTISKLNCKEVIDFAYFAKELNFDYILYGFADSEFRKGFFLKTDYVITDEKLIDEINTTLNDLSKANIITIY